MGYFNKKKPTKTTKTRVPRQQVVTVAFREPSLNPLIDFDPDYGYSYLWPFPEPPRVGMWAYVNTPDGMKTVVVGALGRNAASRGVQLKPLARLIPQGQIDRDVIGPIIQWLDAGRVAAGLSAGGYFRPSIPAGFEPFPPATTSDVSASIAESNGAVWWKAYKKAVELGRDPVETYRYKDIAEAWYAIRTKANKQGRDAEKEKKQRIAKRIHASIGVSGIESAANTRSISDVEGMKVAGLDMWDWLEYVKSIAKEKPDDALAITYALITAAEQEATVSGREPAPAYTERAAMLLRSKKDYAGEISVIERWEKACPPSERGSGKTQDRLLQRRIKARELLAKAQNPS